MKAYTHAMGHILLKTNILLQKQDLKFLVSLLNCVMTQKRIDILDIQSFCNILTTSLVYSYGRVP